MTKFKVYILLILFLTSLFGSASFAMEEAARYLILVKGERTLVMVLPENDPRFVNGSNEAANFAAQSKATFQNLWDVIGFGESVSVSETNIPVTARYAGRSAFGDVKSDDNLRQLAVSFVKCPSSFDDLDALVVLLEEHKQICGFSFAHMSQLLQNTKAKLVVGEWLHAAAIALANNTSLQSLEFIFPGPTGHCHYFHHVSQSLLKSAYLENLVIRSSGNNGGCSFETLSFTEEDVENMNNNTLACLALDGWYIKDAAAVVKIISNLHSLNTVKFSSCTHNAEVPRLLCDVIRQNKNLAHVEFEQLSDAARYRPSDEQLCRCRVAAKHNRMRGEHFLQGSSLMMCMLMPEKTQNLYGNSLIATLPSELIFGISLAYGELASLEQRTTISIIFYGGVDKRIFVRGNFGGFNWDKGIELERIANNLWEIELDPKHKIDAKNGTCEFIVLLNDEIEEAGESSHIVCSHHCVVKPVFGKSNQ